MRTEERICHWAWEPGARKQGFVPVEGGGAELPAALLCGGEPGPMVLLTAGIHSAEYSGVQAAIELAETLRPRRGGVAILPLLNPTGFAHRTMSTVYEDEKNLNRVFPGRPDGTLAERIAHTVTERFLKRADACIDLHGGDGYEELRPYVYCQGAADAETAARSRAMASWVDVPYVVRSPVPSGGAFNHAGALGVPGILLERGGLGLWSREEAEADKADVENVLRFLGVLEGDPVSPARPLRELETVHYLTADYTGCWYPAQRTGNFVRRGEGLGAVRDFFGRTLQTLQAPADGVLLFQARSLSAVKNGPLAALGAIGGSV